MALTSIGDLSRSLMLRQGNLATKSDLMARTQELTTGIRNDIPAAMGGDTRQLSQIETRLSTLAAYTQSATELGHRATAMQHSLGAVQDAARALGPVLVQAGTTPSMETLAVATAQAHQQLADLVGHLNTDVGGRHLFAGTRVTSAPLPPADALLATIRTAIGSPPSANDLIAAVTAFFDAPPGGGGFVDNAYQGTTAPMGTAVAPGQTASIHANATTPAIRDTLKGVVLLALAAEAPWTGDVQAQARIVTTAGETLLNADTGLSVLRGTVGATEAAVSKAQTRHAAETAALGLARNDLVLADRYEAASAVAEAEARMEAIYSMTARLSRLSLAAYL